MKEFVIDAISDENYFVITKNGKPFAKCNKRNNTLESVIKFIGEENIKEVKK